MEFAPVKIYPPPPTKNLFTPLFEDGIYIFQLIKSNNNIQGRKKPENQMQPLGKSQDIVNLLRDPTTKGRHHRLNSTVQGRHT